MLLHSAGFGVATHPAGFAFLCALRSIGEDGVRCVVADVWMPGLDGAASRRSPTWRLPTGLPLSSGGFRAWWPGGRVSQSGRQSENPARPVVVHDVNPAPWA